MAVMKMGDTIERMTDSPYGVTPGGTWPPPGPLAGPPPVWPPPAPKQSRAPVIISLVVALIAVAVAIGAWFRPAREASPPPDSTPQYSTQQVADATKAMCAAYDKIYAALSGAGGQSSSDPNVQLTIAVNTRLATHVNSDYLRQVLAQNPATPPALVDTFREMAAAYDEIVLAQLGGAQTADLGAPNAKLEDADEKAAKACK